VPDCEATFHAFLTYDFSDPGYGAVHHLVVAAYMLQHDQYDDETRETMLATVVPWLDRAPTDHDRAQIRAAFDGPRRAIKRESRAPSVPRAWRLTVEDVNDSSAEAYRRTVRTWAAATIETLM
jgi:hypothetical protein